MSLVGGAIGDQLEGRTTSMRIAAKPGSDLPTKFLFQYLEPFDESNPSKVLLLKLWLDICRRGFDFPHCQLGHARVLLPRSHSRPLAHSFVRLCKKDGCLLRFILILCIGTISIPEPEKVSMSPTKSASQPTFQRAKFKN